MTVATKKKKTQKKKPSKKREPTTLEADRPASRCPKCGSTDRSSYIGRINIQEISGWQCEQCHRPSLRSGVCPCGGKYKFPFTKIIRRRCRCENCNQIRFDRTCE